MNISNAEMKVMNKIWEKGKAVTIGDLVTTLHAEGEEWSYLTVATFLRRLEPKGFLSSIKKKNKLSYFPLISKEEYKKREAKGFIDNQFSGSLKNFLVAFSGGDVLNDDDMKDLREWLDGFDD